MEKLQAWLDITKQYQKDNFWKEIFQISDHQELNPKQPQSQPEHSFYVNKTVFPRCDVYREEQNIIIEAEVPGISRNKLNVSLFNQHLHIKGEIASFQTKNQYLLKERHNGIFEKSIPLPSPVKQNDIQSILQHGILTIILPLDEEEVESIDWSLHDKNKNS